MMMMRKEKERGWWGKFLWWFVYSRQRAFPSGVICTLAVSYCHNERKKVSGVIEV